MPDEELIEAQKYFFCTNHIVDIKPNDLVVGRYSVLPFYNEQSENIEILGGKLVNSYKQHLYVADLGAYVNDLGEDMTPRTWSELSHVNPDQAPFVLKGQTNSKKHMWQTHMFANTFEDAKKVYSRLMEDNMIGEQRIYIRKYLPLVQLGKAVTGLPFTKEFRVFVYNGKVVSKGFYWSALNEDISAQGYEIPSVSDIPEDFLGECIWRIGKNCNFYTIDVAQDITGKWWVIELNDGNMAGLSEIPPSEFYKNLYELMSESK